jgi:hypothetical protein
MDTIAEQLHALEVTAVRLAEERDQHKAHAERAWAAAEDIANTVMNVVCENGRLRDTNKALNRENQQLRTENAALEVLRQEVAQFAGQHRFRRGR